MEGYNYSSRFDKKKKLDPMLRRRTNNRLNRNTKIKHLSLKRFGADLVVIKDSLYKHEIQV